MFQGRAELVFSGTVVSITRTAALRYRATFYADRVWRGDVTRRFDLDVDELEAEVPHFAEGGYYLVFARRMGGRGGGIGGAAESATFSPIPCSDVYSAGLENMRLTIQELGPAQPGKGADGTEEPGAPLTERVMQSISHESSWQILQPFTRGATGSRSANGHWMDGTIELSMYLNVLESAAAAARTLAERVRYATSTTEPVSGYGDRAFSVTDADTTEIAFQKHNIFVRVVARRGAAAADGPSGGDRGEASIRAARIVDDAITGEVSVTTCVDELMPDRRAPARSLAERLFRAAQSGCIPELQAALTAGANPNAKVGQTLVLTVAVARMDIEVVQQLLKAGADPNVADEFGRTPLWWIPTQPIVYRDPSRTLSDRLALVDALVAAGADINARSKTRSTILLDLSGPGAEYAFLEGLIARGADVRVRDDQGDTVLTLLISRSTPEVLQNDKRIPMLIAAGVDVNARNAKGNTAIDIVRAKAALPQMYYDLNGVIRTLTSAGAK
jgi:hypothetical protein